MQNSAEVAVVLSCLARTIHRGENAGILQRINWPHLIRVACRHRVMPIVYQSLAGLDNDAFPAEALQVLHHLFRTNALRNTYLTAELARLLATLTALEIPAIPFKGPVLAVSCFGGLEFRQFNDLDVLIRKRDFARAARALESSGYRQISEYSWESLFADNRGLALIDLHWRIVPNDVHFPLDFDAMFRRTKPLLVAGSLMPNLAPEDMLQVLCVQFAKDSWGNVLQLSRICDIAELLRTKKEIDWGQVLMESRQSGSELMLFLGLQLAHDLLGTPLSVASIRKTRSVTVRSIAREIQHKMFLDNIVRRTSFSETARAQSAMRERLRDKIFPYCVRFVDQVLIPNERDRAIVWLPDAFSFLYYVVRPCRLVGKYFMGRYGWNPMADLFKK